ncbi:Cof-type HAD-IIB family hydrolase [Virgibacillus sediminis]|uniref:Cof-type HAD-IIB family hydrolase n=1 Tax=Virgibacillus sediminis TaxID=202260 RepID=A0ABV7A360_9BACI
MPDIKLIALDMDGTLLTHEQEVTDPVKQAIQKALEKDIHVVLSTGRGLTTCYPYAEPLKLQSYLITANGGQVWTVEKELLQQHLLESKKIEKMWEIGESLNLDMWMLSTERVFRAERPDNFHDYEWLKFGCNSFDEATLDKMVKELSFMDGLEMTNSLPTNIEVNPQGVSKANALQFVCGEIGIEMGNVLAVGDSLNDIKMIQEAGIGVAMGNAQEAIKKAADFVTDTNENDGVAKAIEKFAL